MRHLLFAGVILTCLTSAARNEYTSYQVDGAILFVNGCLEFSEAKGDNYKACDVACTAIEGTLKQPGTDLRDEDPPLIRNAEGDDAK